MAAPRTQRQKQVLDYIIRFLERRGYTPSYAQIANHLGVKSRATVHKHIKALVRLKADFDPRREWNVPDHGHG